MIKAVIFDLDGVLINSAPVVDVARREAFAQYNVDIDSVPDPHGEGHSGSSIQNILGEVEKHTGVVIDYADYSEKFNKSVRDGLSKTDNTTDPKLLQLLSDLKIRGIDCAIATSSSTNSFKIKMDVLKIYDFFKVIITANDVTKHKPAPDIYLAAIKKLKLQPNNCIVVEDSNAGIEAGARAGCKVIGFTKYRANKDKPPTTFMAINSWDEISAQQLADIR